MLKRKPKKRLVSKVFILIVLLLIIIISFFVKTQKDVSSKQILITKFSFLSDISKLKNSIKYVSDSNSLNPSDIEAVSEPRGFKPTGKDYTLFDEEFGKSYVEIDLTRQKVWVYVDNHLKVETDCVTGCIDKGYETPTGIFTLTYKEKDKVLRGRMLENGSYEYESPVKYWMPFNGGIGLHDASWRDTFGNDIYISNGSHGCINLPLDSAERIYDLINSDMPIIVYKSY